MKKQLLLSTLFTYILSAQNILLTPEQEKNWQINTKKPQVVQSIPLGEFIAEVVAPPSLMQTISVPFEANVKKLYVAKYQKVNKGDILAEVTGTEWIAAQQKAISDAIEFEHHKHLAERKNMLCKEGIIPKKECAEANAELHTDKIKVSASRALLASYGASDEMIARLFKALELSQTISIKSKVSGSIVGLNATLGQSTNPSDALFIIQKKGALWLEGNLEANLIKNLHEGEKVQITLENHTFNATILQLSPTINLENQSRQIRFSLPLDIDILPGLRTNATITVLQQSLKINKKSVIKNGEDQIVFIQTKDGYSAVKVTILTEDDRYYYVKPSANLDHKIATSSVAILKNMIGSKDE